MGAIGLPTPSPTPSPTLLPTPSTVFVLPVATATAALAATAVQTPPFLHKTTRARYSPQLAYFADGILHIPHCCGNLVSSALLSMLFAYGIAVSVSPAPLGPTLRCVALESASPSHPWSLALLLLQRVSTCGPSGSFAAVPVATRYVAEHAAGDCYVVCW